MSHEHENETVIEFSAVRLARQIAHGSGHMGTANLIARLLALLVAAGMTVWTLTAGHTVLPLFGALLFGVYLALAAVELYAAGALCDQITKEQERGR
ncbi:hypothetical protein [Nocardiopsis kunsanensis]|uniref:hypothetical protein n=1 Tax=Nocardiopsis kunsanensis TaxID=141693 RepID=UPI000348CD6F|nr:hypothetical protein [Nocardiopsis kunsanensis]